MPLPLAPIDLLADWVISHARTRGFLHPERVSQAGNGPTPMAANPDDMGLEDEDADSVTDLFY
jgi:hypothetical protein